MFPKRFHENQYNSIKDKMGLKINLKIKNQNLTVEKGSLPSRSNIKTSGDIIGSP